MSNYEDDKKDRYKSVEPDVAPTGESGDSLVDLYVHLPTNKKYIKWVTKGDTIEPKHLNKIKNHIDPNFYAEELVREEPIVDPIAQETQSEANAEVETQTDYKVFSGETERYENARIVLAERKEKESEKEELIIIQRGNHLDTIKNLFGSEKAEVLAEPIDKELKSIYADIGDAKPGKLSLQDSKLEELSEKICSVVSPEVGDVRAHLKNVPAFVSIMDESSAISTLAILFAVAQGQKTRGVFKDLSYACLLMDISLLGVSEEAKKSWLMQPETLTDAERIIIETHPRKSHAVVMEKFKNLPEIVGQMILGHHELFSGRGFPRKVRSDLLPPVVRILAFAVDVHYHMKRAEMKGESLDIETVVESFTDSSIEPHLRRHNIELCRKILKYMIEGDTE
jgi:HD-GYP domain-containing protein (c-di-GMP phosphodiesterase class II)